MVTISLLVFCFFLLILKNDPLVGKTSLPVTMASASHRNGSVTTTTTVGMSQTKGHHVVRTMGVQDSFPQSMNQFKVKMK